MITCNRRVMAFPGRTRWARGSPEIAPMDRRFGGDHAPLTWVALPPRLGESPPISVRDSRIGGRLRPRPLGHFTCGEIQHLPAVPLERLPCQDIPHASVRQRASAQGPQVVHGSQSGGYYVLLCTSTESRVGVRVWTAASCVHPWFASTPSLHACVRSGVLGPQLLLADKK